jgi:hypothetical protein
MVKVRKVIDEKIVKSENKCGMNQILKNEK